MADHFIDEEKSGPTWPDKKPIEPQLFREFAEETILNLQRLGEEVEIVLSRVKELYREIDEQGADDFESR